MWDQFRIGFWHPFGAYTGLSATQVLDWKSAEVARHGWTFWSFVYSPTAEVWIKYLSDVRGPVYALCSHSPGASDPDTDNGALLATQYRFFGSDSWKHMPDPNVMKVTNPFKRNGLAVGFKVSRVTAIEPTVPPFGVEWYSRGQGAWRADSLPTRGEYLVRQGGETRLRRVCAVLELASPYLVELRHGPSVLEAVAAGQSARRQKKK